MIIVPQAPLFRGTQEENINAMQRYLTELSENLSVSLNGLSSGGGETKIVVQNTATKKSGISEIPVATDKILGGIKVGTNLSIEADGTLSATAPSTGIPKSDLASDVQTSLNKADTALQSYTETDPTVPAWAKANAKPSYTAGEVGAYTKTEVDSKIAAAKTSIASYKIVTSFMSSLNLLSIAWSAFGSGVSLSTFTNIFNNHLLYSIIVNDPAEDGSGETKLIFDNFNDNDQACEGKDAQQERCTQACDAAQRDRADRPQNE